FLDHTIVVGNQDLSGRAPDIAGIFNSRYSLIGLGADFLGPLADNGGPTMTHALVPGSPAINAGDPAAKAGVGGVPLYDQRGAPFTRVYGGRIDIGALEAQPNPLTGDYNFSGVVDAADAVVWRKTLGSTTDLRADGNGDGVVDQADWQVWRENFGRTAESVEQGARSTEPEESPPNRPAWQPPASPGVSLATSRPTFRPAAQGFAPQDNLLAALASPRSTSHLRNDFAPERWNPTRNIDFGLAEANVDAFDRVFETVGWATPTIKRRL
ncbi:MAG TPA: choice-of-anchor Q domain-containing protein, partial [Lacipirellulaceae bacterium]